MPCNFIDRGLVCPEKYENAWLDGLIIQYFLKICTQLISCTVQLVSD